MCVYVCVNVCVNVCVCVCVCISLSLFLSLTLSLSLSLSLCVNTHAHTRNNNNNNTDYGMLMCPADQSCCLEEIVKSQCPSVHLLYQGPIESTFQYTAPRGGGGHSHIHIQ
jgi:hypothetical protein